MKALGMLEVYGYLAAVEALDSALKAANVKLVDVTLVQGGLVTVLITGDVGAVKAAMDASKTAAERVGRVISVHVIPRPSEQTLRIVPFHSVDLPSVQKASKVKGDQEEITSSVLGEVLTEAVMNEEESQGREDLDVISETEASIHYTEEQLKDMTVDRLRSLARELDITNMTRKEIRFATKQELIDSISKFKEMER